MLLKGNNLRTRNIRNILLIQLGDIGDAVLSFPAIRALRENFPRSRLVVAVREKAKELIEDCPWASTVISVNQEQRSLVKRIAYQRRFFSRLRKFNFDLAVDLRTETRGAILAFLSGARQRVGRYADDGKLWRNRVFTHLTLPLVGYEQYVAEYYLDILTSYDIATENVWPEVVVPPDKRERAAELFAKEGISTDLPVIAIQPFSLWQYKELSSRKYVQLIDWIWDTFELPVIIGGSLEERQRAEQIIRLCKHQNLFNFAGRTSIGTYAAVLQACKLFVGTDSAGVHIAAAVGTPTVSIFGPTSPVCWAPKGEQHTVITKDLPCIPCKEKGCQDGDLSRCLEELSFEEIREKIEPQIAAFMHT